MAYKVKAPFPPTADPPSFWFLFCSHVNPPIHTESRRSSRQARRPFNWDLHSCIPACCRNFPTRTDKYAEKVEKVSVYGIRQNYTFDVLWQHDVPPKAHLLACQSNLLPQSTLCTEQLLLLRNEVTKPGRALQPVGVVNNPNIIKKTDWENVCIPRQQKSKSLTYQYLH